jgi:hypothetical protein
MLSTISIFKPFATDPHCTFLADGHLNLHPLDQQLLRRIWHHGPPQRKRRVSLRQPVGHLDIEVQDESRHNHLGLVRGKEASRTSARPIAKHEIGFVRRHEQIASMNGCVILAAVAQLVMPEAVEFLRIGPDL